MPAELVAQLIQPRGFLLELVLLRPGFPQIFLCLVKLLMQSGKALLIVTNAVHIMRGVLAVAGQHNNIGYRQAAIGEIGWALDVEPRINILQRSFGRKRRGVFQVVVAATA